MKIFHLLPQPDLTKVTTSTDFAASNKYNEPGSLLIPLENRFPIKREMPIKNPELGKDASLERSYKFISELTVLDRELMMIAYRHAMQDGETRKLRHRDEWETAAQKRADIHAIENESNNQRMSILRGWLKRFHMEKVFKHLKIETMDDFKLLMQHVHHKTDVDKALIHKLLLRQNGRDPSQMISPTDMARISVKEEEVIRLKINFGHKELLAVDEMKRRIAEQQASAAVTQVLQQQQQNISRMYHTSSPTNNSPQTLAATAHAAPTVKRAG